jgi:beta-lactamase class D
LLLALAGCTHAAPPPSSSPPASPRATRSCFLLHEVGVGPVTRAPAEGCAVRVTPASTFKIPHALAALDAGVLTPDEVFRYDGKPWKLASYRRDHTLPTAIHSSVLWYFQQLAQRLGPERERAYLEKFSYGNADISSGLTTFWLYQSLEISPDEQERFLLRLFQDTLPIDHAAQDAVRRAMIQPAGSVVNAVGVHPFAQPWPPDAIVSAKTGSASEPNRPDVRWLIGHVRRGPRTWTFVSNVVGHGLPPLAAVDLAAASLKRAGVL